MPDQLQLRGGTTTEHNSFTGALREVTVDTTKKTLVVHDGASAGGTALMKESGSNAAASIILGTGGNNAFRIHTDQKVGVGVNTPIAALDVNGVSSTSIKIRNTGTVAAIDLSIDSQQNSLYSRGINSSTGRDFRFVQGSSEKIRVTTDGKVGISTSSPVYSLDVTGSIRATSQGRFGNGSSSSPAYSFNGDSDTGMYRATTNSLSFATAGTERLNIDSQGNLGIRGGSSLFFSNGFNNSTGRIQNAGSTNNSNFRFLTTNNGTEGERMRITASGTVGIGTSNPSSLAALEVSGRIGLTGLNDQMISPSFPFLYRSGSSSGSYPFNDFGHLIIQSRGDGSNRDIVFATGSAGVNKSVISASGNMGLGTTNPSQKLDLRLGQSAAYSTTGSPTHLGIGNINSSANTNFAGIHMYSDGNGRGIINLNCKNNSTNASADFTIQTRHSGTLSERFRLTSNGNVGIGTTAPTVGLDCVGAGRFGTFLLVGATAQHNSSALNVTGSFSNSQSQTCAIFLNSDNTTLLKLRSDRAFFSDSIYHQTTASAANVHVRDTGFVTRATSSKDYKKNIKDALWGLADVLKLRPVTFQSNAVGEFADDHTYGGFISEELHESGLTEFVQYDGNNKAQGISYGHMVALLTKAIQELTAKVEALEAA